jgi:hypothetical protein
MINEKETLDGVQNEQRRGKKEDKTLEEEV